MNEKEVFSTLTEELTENEKVLYANTPSKIPTLFSLGIVGLAIAVAIFLFGYYDRSGGDYNLNYAASILLSLILGLPALILTVIGGVAYRRLNHGQRFIVTNERLLIYSKKQDLSVVSLDEIRKMYILDQITSLELSLDNEKIILHGIYNQKELIAALKKRS